MVREVTIRTVLNGWIVQVGCQTLVFDELEEFISALRMYLRNPDEQEKYWREYGQNAKHTFLDVPVAPPNYPQTEPVPPPQPTTLRFERPWDGQSRTVRYTGDGQPYEVPQ